MGQRMCMRETRYLERPNYSEDTVSLIHSLLRFKFTYLDHFLLPMG